MSSAPRRRRAQHLLWAGLVAVAAVLAGRPGDPGPVPPVWLVALALLAVLSARGSAVAWAVLVGLNGLLLASALLAAWPIGAQLTTFYLLVAAGLAVLATARPASRVRAPAG